MTDFYNPPCALETPDGACLAVTKLPKSTASLCVANSI